MLIERNSSTAVFKSENRETKLSWKPKLIKSEIFWDIKLIFFLSQFSFHLIVTLCDVDYVALCWFHNVKPSFESLRGHKRDGKKEKLSVKRKKDEKPGKYKIIWLLFLEASLYMKRGNAFWGRLSPPFNGRLSPSTKHVANAIVELTHNRQFQYRKSFFIHKTLNVFMSESWQLQPRA